MTRNRTLHRWTLAAMSAAALTLTIAQVAEARPGSHGWRHEDRGRWGRPVHRVVYREMNHGGAGPALAGLVGGFILGATLTHPHPVYVQQQSRPVCVRQQPVYVQEPEPVYAPQQPQYATPAPSYRYEDGNGERWWDTLGEARDAAYGSDGPRVIKVVDARTNRCVDTLYWKHDHFVSDNGDRYDDNDRGGYRDQDDRDGR